MVRLLLVIVLTLAASPWANAVEVRICEREIRTTPLNDERAVQSALIHAFAVVNTSKAVEKLTGLTLELKENGKLRDKRWLLATDVTRAVKQGPEVAAIAKIFPFQFCNGKLLEGVSLAKSDVLAPGEALVFMNLPFTWAGSRDEISISAVTEPKGAAQEAVATIPIVARTSKTLLLFPVAGRSFAAVGASFHTPHRWATIEEFAYDILHLTGEGSTHRGNGTELTDYAAFGRPVRAAASGKVVAVRDGDLDNKTMLRLPTETDDAYLTRLQEGQMALIAKGIGSVLGNHVVIDHGNEEFSVYAHLKQNSILVKVGDTVASGKVIGALGSSGNSTEPHLHFQVCDNPDVSVCRTIPANFTGYRLPFELAPRTIQSGDIVETIQ